MMRDVNSLVEHELTYVEINFDADNFVLFYFEVFLELIHFNSAAIHIGLSS